MKRWRVKLDDVNEISLYCPALQDAIRFPGAIKAQELPPWSSPYIDEIRSCGTLVGRRDGHETYRINGAYGDVIVTLLYDPMDGSYYDKVKYQEIPRGSTVVPMAWSLDGLEDFYRNVILRKEVICRIHSRRKWGEPKLEKPGELSGRRMCFSTSFNQKVKCQCFMEGDNIWIKHRDFFSPIWQPPSHDAGHDTDYYLQKYFGVHRPPKYTYANDWSAIVLRAEAWIVLENAIPLMNHVGHRQAVTVLLEAFCEAVGSDAYDIDTEWYHFFEGIYEDFKRLTLPTAKAGGFSAQRPQPST